MENLLLNIHFVSSAKYLLTLLPSETFISKKTETNNAILVTGGSGFLGIHLLKELVMTNRYTNIYTIVRNKHKLKEQAQYFQLNTDWLDNVTIIEGDLLSLSESEFPNVEYIIHSAAKIHCLHSLNRLWTDNVLATHKILQIYQYNKVKFMSTLSVFVSSNLTGNHLPQSLLESNDYLLYGGYAQSKYIAEKLTEKYNQSIIRLGLLTGSSKTGVFPVDFFSLFIKLNKQLGCYPLNYENSYVDITPVDYCANSICNRIQDSVAIMHIANKQSAELAEFIKICDLKAVSKALWLNKVSELSTLEQILMKYAYFKSEMLNSYFNYFNIDLFQATNHTFNIQNSFDKSNTELLQYYIYNNKCKEK